jgi:hypothetical protein
VATTYPQFDIWLEELECLVRQVDGWFRQATARFEPPSDSGCRMVAFYLMVFRYPLDDETPDTRKQAINHGKAFLRYIEPERRQKEAALFLASRGRPPGNWMPEYREILFRIDETRRHLEALLPALSPKRDASLDPIRRLASVAKEAWAETNGGEAPRSRNPDGPLCRFLIPALAAAGLSRSPAAISDVLRGRRRKSKDGQNR